MSFLLVTLFLACLLVASAFSPMTTSSRMMSSLRMSDTPASAPEPVVPAAPVAPVIPPFSAKNEAGVSGPFGFFDPLDLVPVSKRDFVKWRESELKHGRVAMLAVVGVFFGEKAGLFFGDSITGPAIFQYQQAESMFNAWSWNVVGLTAAIEGYNIVKGWESSAETLASSDGVASLKAGYVNGDLKFDPLGLKPRSDKDFKAMATKEINNGRLAMIAIAGIVAQELVTGQSVF